MSSNDSGRPDARSIFDPGETGRVMLGLGATLEIFMLIAVTARLYVKQRILRRWTPDDFTCIVAALATTAYFVTGCYVVTTAASNSIAADHASNDFLISTWLTQWLSPLSFVFTKLSFFLLYLQVFRPIKFLRVAAMVGAVYCLLLWGFLFFFRLIAITPRQGEPWSVVQINWGAQTNHILVLVAGPFDILSDLHIVLLPLVGINQLRISGRKKLGVLAVVLTGLLAVVASAVSMYFRVGFAAAAPRTQQLQETFYNTTLCVIVELQIGVFCCCMPAVSALLRQRFASWDLSSCGGRGRAGGASSTSHPYNDSRHTYHYADVFGKQSRYSRTVTASNNNTSDSEALTSPWSSYYYAASEAADAVWKAPPLPGRYVTTTVREISKASEVASGDGRFELGEVSRHNHKSSRNVDGSGSSNNSYPFIVELPSSPPSPRLQKQQHSRRGSLLLSMVPAAIRPSPRASRRSSVRRSATSSPWGVRRDQSEERQSNAPLSDGILVETDIHVVEESRWARGTGV